MIVANPFRNLALSFELASPLRRLRQLLALESLVSFQSSLRSHIDPSKQKTANAFARRLRLKERKLDHAKAQSKPTVPSMDESCACLQARESYMLSGAPIAIHRNSALGGNFANDLTADVARALDGRIQTISFERERLPQDVAAAPAGQ